MVDREVGEEVAGELFPGLAVYSCTARAGGNKRNLLSLGERRGIASVARVSERAGGESGRAARPGHRSPQLQPTWRSIRDE